MCCRPCEGERRAGDNRKIRRAATYIDHRELWHAQYASSGLPTDCCRHELHRQSFHFDTRGHRTNVTQMKHSKPCHSQENVNSTISAPFAHHVVRRSPSAETRAQRRLQWQAPRRIRCPSC